VHAGTHDSGERHQNDSLHTLLDLASGDRAPVEERHLETRNPKVLGTLRVSRVSVNRPHEPIGRSCTSPRRGARPAPLTGPDHGAINRLSGLSESTWSDTALTTTSIGTASSVPQPPQSQVHTSTPRKTTTTCIRSARPSSGGVS